MQSRCFGALSESTEGILLLGEALAAAARATEDARIGALGRSLSTAAVDGATIQAETLFVRAVADLDLVHVRVLAAFKKSSNELGLGSGEPDFDGTVSSLNRTQLSEYVFPDLVAVLEPVIATLTRHALLRQGSGSWADLEGNPTYRITAFGEECLRRLGRT